MLCPAKHTAYQPEGEDWKCPNCGADAEYFTIEDYPENIDLSCGLIHTDDDCYCRKCERSFSGATVAKRLMKQKNLVTCLCCKGKGFEEEPTPSVKELR